MKDVLIHTIHTMEQLLLSEPSAKLLSSEKHDRNENLLVNCPRLRKRQRSQATVSPSQQEMGAPRWLENEPQTT